MVSFRAMPEEPQKPTKAQLALALARGSSIRAWAKANNVPPGPRSGGRKIRGEAKRPAPHTRVLANAATALGEGKRPAPHTRFLANAATALGEGKRPAPPHPRSGERGYGARLLDTPEREITIQNAIKLHS